MNTNRLIDKQRRFFNSNTTKSVKFRIRKLKQLRQALIDSESLLYNALYEDLGKSKTEAYMTEISIVHHEIDYAIKNVEHWSKTKSVGTNISTFPSRNKIYNEPYGVVLVVSPWNYPINLSLTPIIGAIAAGNCVILKGSEMSVETSKVLNKIISDTFESEYFYCLDPNIEHNEWLNQKYDYIFFTGSSRVGKIIMNAASNHLTPVSLELGGKSPCIIEKSANLKLAAKRIVWGKFMNAGQTCISVDYIIIENSVHDKFLKYLKQEIEKRYPHAETNSTYPKIINYKHYNRLTNLIKSSSNVIGGKTNEVERKIAPTIIDHSSFSDKIMKEEIFGPILPIITYESIEDVIDIIKDRPKPLALYFFSENRKVTKKVLSQISFGGGCVNDVLLQISNNKIPFGGVGESGIGGYHGRYSFDTFSHKKGIVHNTTLFDIPLRYAPYNDAKFKILRKFL